MPTLRFERDKHTGTKLGRYEILCQLSTGGMSDIYLGFQRGLGGFTKVVVLKCMSQSYGGDEGLLHMFLDEGRITAAFSHPNIGQVFDLGEDAGQLFLAMEFIPGATLNELARALRAANEGIPIGFALATVRDTALALHYAHTFTDPLGRPAQVVHRDVAGKNIMITYEGVTKLLDFGIAKMSASMEKSRVVGVKGTSGYMAPEQLMSMKVDGRTDVFALGVVLHECLTGNRLFYGKTFAEEVENTLSGEVPLPSSINGDVPEELDNCILKALEKEPEARYASALEFARAIESSAGYLLWRPEQRAKLLQEFFAERRDQARKLFASLDVQEQARTATPTPSRKSEAPRRATPSPALEALPVRKSGSHAARGSGPRTPVPPPAGRKPTPAPGSLENEPKTPAVGPPASMSGPPVDMMRTVPATQSPIKPFDPFEGVDLEPEVRTVIATRGELATPDVDNNTLVGAKLPRRRGGSRFALVGGAIVAVGLVVGFGMWSKQRMQPPAPPTSKFAIKLAEDVPPAPPKDPVRPEEHARLPDSPRPAEPARPSESPRVAEKPAPDSRPKPSESLTNIQAPAVPAPPAPKRVPASPPKPRRFALILDTTPKSEVSLSDRALGSTPLNVPLPPGTYDLTVVGADGVRRKLKVEMTSSANTVLKVPLTVLPVE